ncbi:Hypothetical protein SRAE_2000282100 [Strongyloides ratti]|uniref:Uncharacterized protein n=1 Tax=Strongyloides ratti TaxID=34506 RepID=A0A090LJ44_STRRB|nr:Hypothetical protein SRAE_2000282100 [Strongyloides ratti]CEF68163.1 Hypothetical protein SRAE_2000282100 [Strongyloides ratti]
MTFKLDCQVVNKLDDIFKKNLLLFQNKHSSSSQNSLPKHSKEVLELINDGARARCEIMKIYSDLINAIEKYEKLTNNIETKLSEPLNENSDSVKPEVSTVPNEDTKENVEEQISGKSIDNILDKQNPLLSEHLQTYTMEENKEYILNSISIPQPPELNFNY